MIKTTPSYKEQATTIFNFNKDNNLGLLESTLIELSDINDKPIYDLNVWLINFRDNYELVHIIQASNHFDTTDNFILEGVYRRDYKTSNDILELIDEDEAIEWIANALEGNSPYIKDLEMEMITNYSYLKGDF